MLVFVFAAILSYDANWILPLTSKASVMMALDHSGVPAVVLVVEDEMLLRMRAIDMVEDAGYTSVEAVDADEAVAILDSRSDIAVMFTDTQMPGSMARRSRRHRLDARSRDAAPTSEMDREERPRG